MTTGSRNRCVHWIERDRFSGYWLWNYVCITYRFQLIAVLVFKGDFALQARFLGEKGGGAKYFFKILTPKRHFLSLKHAVWYIPRGNWMNGATCSLTEEPPKNLNNKLFSVIFRVSAGKQPRSGIS